MDLNTLFISTIFYVGEVELTIDNLITGEHIEDSFDSAMNTFFPISGNAGIWTVLLTLQSGENFLGEFVL